MNISNTQRKTLKIIKAGGLIIPWRKGGIKNPLYKYRLLDVHRNPLRYVHGRTFKALVLKELITKKSDGSYAAIGAEN